MSLTRRLDEARLALMLLTRLPVGRLRDPAPTLADAAWAYPIAGVPVGLVGWAVFFCGSLLGLPPLPAALASVSGMALLTGALHFDGLADFADGIGGGRDRAHILEIMRDSRIGSYGTLALILAVGMVASLIAEVSPGDSLAAFLLISVASRLAMVGALATLPPARVEGLGTSAAVTGHTTILPGTGLVLLLGVWAGSAALWILIPIALSALVVCLIARRAIGGQTGDVLGSVQLISAISGWAGLVASLSQ